MRPVSSHFLNLLIVDLQGFGVGEQELLSTRFKPVEAGYHHELRCMDDTQKSLLNQIMDWVANKSNKECFLQRDTYWFYGSPGIGKTLLAHSICANLDERDHLRGAIFCRRDDPILSNPINILPTFIYKLAMIFFFFFFFFGGGGGEIFLFPLFPFGPLWGSPQGIPLGLFPPWRDGPVSPPLKPPLFVFPGYILSGE